MGLLRDALLRFTAPPRPSWVNPADEARFDELVAMVARRKRILADDCVWARALQTPEEAADYRRSIERDIEVGEIEIDRLLDRATTRPTITAGALLMRVPAVNKTVARFIARGNIAA